MRRRVLGPWGGALAFAAVALLVVGGLTWVTIEALHVESEQRLATARADASQSERLALWKLDSRLFPAWGVENNRLYAHYFSFYYPCPVGDDGGPPSKAPSPLLIGEAHDWARLYFQLDPELGWRSPQVPDDALEIKLRDQIYAAREPDCLQPARMAALEGLKRHFPVRELHEQLMSLELKSPDSVWAVPYTTESPRGVTVQPVPAEPGAAGQESTLRSGNGGQSPEQRNGAANRPAEPKPEQNVAGGGRGGNRNYIPPTGKPEAPGGAVANNSRGDPSQQGGRDAREDTGSKSMKGLLPKTEEAATPAPAKPPAAPNPSPATPVPEDAGKNNNDPRRANDKGAETANGLQPGAMKKAGEEPRKEAPMLGGAPKPGAKESPKDAKPAEEKKDALKEQEGKSQAELSKNKAGEERIAGADRNLLAAEDAKKPANPNLRPPLVQLGLMRPLWIRGADGTEALVLVRAARLEKKTVFQGVLLDWPRLREVLTEEVQPLLPEARIEPVREESTPTERRMTALPAALDPGPEPAPPPAGWTPLRIGLTLGWVAALAALAAVGFVGWTLIDLSERRIRFVSAVTHELRTPLTAMRLSTDLLANGMIAEEEKQREHLRIIGSESERLNTLIENVLDFAKLEKRTVRAECAPQPIGDLLEQVKSTWAERLANEGRELVIVTTLPAEQQVTTDARIAAQIIGNLIDNARKYSCHAEEKRIWLWAKPGERGKVVLEVEDRGPGVPAAEIAAIFRPFRRGQNVHSTGGAGLGLALAKQWTDLLGGTLSYRPADGGVGACFRLELPAA